MDLLEDDSVIEATIIFTNNFDIPAHSETRGISLSATNTDQKKMVTKKLAQEPQLKKRDPKDQKSEASSVQQAVEILENTVSAIALINLDTRQGDD